MRRCGDVMMGRRCYVLLKHYQDVPIRRRGNEPLRYSGDVPPRRCWMFHLRRTCGVAGPYKKTLLWHHYNILLLGGTDRLFQPDSHFVFGTIMLKNCFRFLESQFCLDNAEERTELWKTDRFTLMKENWQLFNSNLNKYVASSEYLSIDKNTISNETPHCISSA